MLQMLIFLGTDALNTTEWSGLTLKAFKSSSAWVGILQQETTHQQSQAL